MERTVKLAQAEKERVTGMRGECVGFISKYRYPMDGRKKKGFGGALKRDFIQC